QCQDFPERTAATDRRRTGATEMTDHDKLLARIKALFAKTTEAGCTEAEALTAVAKARELIEKHQIDLGAEELKKEGFDQQNIDMDKTRLAFARRILHGIEKFCEVKTWLCLGDIVVIGLRSDAEFAEYLINSLTTFAIAGADLHMATERKIQ